MSLVQLRQASVDVHAFSFFVLRSPAPPRPTLFPYTTLFRSSARRRARDDAPRSTARNAPRENRDDDASPTATAAARFGSCTAPGSSTQSRRDGGTRNREMNDRTERYARPSPRRSKNRGRRAVPPRSAALHEPSHWLST